MQCPLCCINVPYTGTWAKGKWLWFNSKLLANPVSGQYRFIKQKITFDGYSYSLSVPDTDVTVSSTSEPKVWWDEPAMKTYITAKSDCGDAFMSGLAWKVPVDNFAPKAIRWCGTFTCSSPVSNVRWSYGVATYSENSNFLANGYNGLRVQPSQCSVRAAGADSWQYEVGAPTDERLSGQAEVDADTGNMASAYSGV
jgi:hypothetical protein